MVTVVDDAKRFSDATINQLLKGDVSGRAVIIHRARVLPDVTLQPACRRCNLDQCSGGQSNSRAQARMSCGATGHPVLACQVPVAGIEHHWPRMVQRLGLDQPHP